MRITAQAKKDTRERLLRTAEGLFVERGYAETSTRDLATAGGVAAGTLFNYFPNKEALAMTLLADALTSGRAGYRERRRGDEDLAEDLFAYVAAGLRTLERYRGFAGEVLKTALSPFSRTAAAEEGEGLRRRHLDTVEEILAQHGASDASERLVPLHLYWTLYLGVLAFWTHDESEHQADTLVVLDQSMQLFAHSIVTENDDDA